MVYSHWLSPGLGQELGPEPGRMGCMVLRRTFHTASEQKQGLKQGQGRMGYVPTFQVLKLFQWCVSIGFQWLSGVQAWPETQSV